MTRAADALVRSLPRTTLVVGKGGVGKTTCAAALALAASRTAPTLVVTTDPARALPRVLGESIGAEPAALRAAPARRLHAQVLDAAPLRSRFLDRWGGVIRTILDRGTYLDESDIAPLVDTALPGGDEIFSALALAQLLVRGEAYERIVVDTAPTGHTLRLLNLPRTFRALVRLLDAMQEKHRFMVRTLLRTYRADDADAFLGEMGALVSGLEDSLHDAGRCAAVMVTNPQPLVLEETRRYLAALAELRIDVAAIVWNATDAPGALDTRAPQYVVPRLAEWPIGPAGLEKWLQEVAIREPGAANREPRAVSREPGAVSREPGAVSREPGAGSREGEAYAALVSAPASQLPARDSLRPLTIVAGKGGVGKTTVACVLGLLSSDSQDTLLVSTDPAPSLADALAQDIGDAEVPVAGAARFHARQMDATAAFARLRAEYQSRVDALFEGLVARGVDLAHDRAVARDLLALAPPGVDEVHALSLLADALFGGRYGCVVVDPAPTGHLLRMLDMPQLALAWTHQIMRLMLKYKDVAGLGETARELLDFSRSLRALDQLLRDPARCGVVLVTLDEPIVRDETARLARALRERGIAVTACVLNRADAATALPVTDAPVQLEAPEVQPPAGTRALRAWATTWRQRQG